MIKLVYLDNSKSKIFAQNSPKTRLFRKISLKKYEFCAGRTNRTGGPSVETPVLEAGGK